MTKLLLLLVFASPLGGMLPWPVKDLASRQSVREQLPSRGTPKPARKIYPLAAPAVSPLRGAASLKDTLEKGLKARRPEEFEFLQKVVASVDSGTLPVSLVMSSFDWVRRYRATKPSMVVYFERVLRLRAEQAEIQLGF